MSPMSSDTWNATVLRDRRITWRGPAKRGEVDRDVINLPGSDMIGVRITDAKGAVCAADLIHPG